VRHWPRLKLSHVQQGMGEPRAIIQAREIMRVNDAVFCCGCNFRAFGGNSPGTLIDCGLQYVSGQSRCGLVLSKDPVAAPLAPVRCDKSAAQAVTHWAAGAYLDFARRLIIGGKNAACANKHSRNYRRRGDSVLSYRQVCSGWTAREFTEDTCGIGLPSGDPTTAIAGV